VHKSPNPKDNPLIAKNYKTIANIRQGMLQSLQTQDKKTELMNRLKQRGTRNVHVENGDVVSKVYNTLNSMNLKRTIPSTADSDRRKQEEESRSILGKEWYKKVHEGSRK